MKVLILSRSKFLFSTDRLVSEASKKNHIVKVVNPSECAILLKNGNSIITTLNIELNDFDVIIPRIGITSSDHSLALLMEFENQGIYVINKSKDIGIAKDKFKSLQILNHFGIPVPPTCIFRSHNNIYEIIDSLGGLPVVLKTMHGSQGAGVALIESYSGLHSMLDTFWVVGQSPLVQKYYSDSHGCDIRIIVIDGKIHAAMKRNSAFDDFRSNIHRGGIGSKFQLTDKLADLALKCTQILNLDIAGVDIIETDEGPKVLEVNATPGFEAIEEVTGVNIAKYVIELAEKKVQTKIRES